jgi:hypothetical protein
LKDIRIDKRFSIEGCLGLRHLGQFQIRNLNRYRGLSLRFRDGDLQKCPLISSVIIKANSRDDFLMCVKTILYLDWIPSDISAVSLQGLEANRKVTAVNCKITAR